MYSIGIVGATGAVGTEMIRVLEEREFPVAQLKLFAGPSSAGKHLTFRGEQIVLEVASADSFKGLDLALFSAGSDISKQWRSACEEAGCVMVDNSSAFRMERDVPLVIPEINAADITADSSVVAVPNCSTIILLMAVAPLRILAPIKRIVVSTYQAVSGAGAKAMQELEDQSRQTLNGEPVTSSVLPHAIAFNLFCHNTAINDEGYNGEEWKMIQETKKILHDENIAVTATCVRVPIFRAHSESVNIEFKGPRPSVEAIRATLAKFPGVKVVDDRAKNFFPMPKDSAGIDEILVGHIRHDLSNPAAVDLFVSGDQLLKGAALGAVQIAEVMVKKGLVRGKHSQKFTESTGAAA